GDGHPISPDIVIFIRVGISGKENRLHTYFYVVGSAAIHYLLTQMMPGLGDGYPSPSMILGACECAVDIPDQVVRVFDSCRKPQCTAENSGGGTTFITQVLVRCRGRMGDQALGIAQIVGNLDDFQSVAEIECRLLVAFDVKTDQRGTAGHLPCNDICLRMILAPRVNHAG